MEFAVLVYYFGIYNVHKFTCSALVILGGNCILLLSFHFRSSYCVWRTIFRRAKQFFFNHILILIFLFYLAIENYFSCQAKVLKSFKANPCDIKLTAKRFFKDKIFVVAVFLPGEFVLVPRIGLRTQYILNSHSTSRCQAPSPKESLYNLKLCFMLRSMLIKKLFFN